MEQVREAEAFTDLKGRCCRRVSSRTPICTARAVPPTTPEIQAICAAQTATQLYHSGPRPSKLPTNWGRTFGPVLAEKIRAPTFLWAAFRLSSLCCFAPLAFSCWVVMALAVPFFPMARSGRGAVAKAAQAGRPFLDELRGRRISERASERRSHSNIATLDARSLAHEFLNISHT